MGAKPRTPPIAACSTLTRRSWETKTLLSALQEADLCPEVRNLLTVKSPTVADEVQAKPSRESGARARRIALRHAPYSF